MVQNSVATTIMQARQVGIRIKDCNVEGTTLNFFCGFYFYISYYIKLAIFITIRDRFYVK